ncbi:MAG: Lrp/AsnC family transcriptional regulator [Clostridia bacterium]
MSGSEKKILDDIDSKIIELLSENANMTATEISGKVGLSVPAANKRINKLLDCGIIEKYTIILDADKIGKPMMAFISVILDRLSYMDGLMKYVKSERDVLECFAVAGDYDYIIKIRAKNMLDLENKIIRIKEIKGVAKTNTTIVLYTYKNISSVLPDLP